MVRDKQNQMNESGNRYYMYIAIFRREILLYSHFTEGKDGFGKRALYNTYLINLIE